MQVVLLAAMFWTINLGPIYDPIPDKEPGQEEYPFVLMLTKLICTLVLHVTMQPNVEIALKRLQYIKYHPHKFSNLLQPIAICYMKLLVEIGTEFVSMSLTANYNHSLDVVFNFIALGFISDLDEIYYGSIKTALK